MTSVFSSPTWVLSSTFSFLATSRVDEAIFLQIIWVLNSLRHGINLRLAKMNLLFHIFILRSKEPNLQFQFALRYPEGLHILFSMRPRLLIWYFSSRRLSPSAHYLVSASVISSYPSRHWERSKARLQHIDRVTYLGVGGILIDPIFVVDSRQGASPKFVAFPSEEALLIASSLVPIW